MTKDTFDSATALRILDAAEKEFVEKGYDGARVDEIAKRANINKSQLYYYFGSKENILKELISRNVKEAERIVDETFSNITISQKGAFEEFALKLLDFFKSKENIIKIVTIEALKSNSNDYYIFDLFNPFYKKIKNLVAEMGFEAQNEIPIHINYFFLDIAPIVFFISFKRKFNEYYKVDDKATENCFWELYKQLPLKYFENIQKKEGNHGNSKESYKDL